MRNGKINSVEEMATKTDYSTSLRSMLDNAAAKTKKITCICPSQMNGPPPH